jgi:hypothetical protein
LVILHKIGYFLTHELSAMLVSFPSCPARMQLQNLVRSHTHAISIRVVDAYGAPFIQLYLAETDTSFIAASEVSSILESRISGTAVAGNVEETGRVLSSYIFCLSLLPCLSSLLGVGDGIGRVWGLRNVQGQCNIASAQPTLLTPKLEL